MIYEYIRFSTKKQDEESQKSIISDYCKHKGIQIDKTIMDEGITGKQGSFDKRKLKDLLSSMKQGDTLIISELSRLTRGGTVELNMIIGQYFIPSKMRLVLCNYGLDIDCTDISPMMELFLNNMATFAKIERDSISSRTKAGVRAAMESGKKIGRANESYSVDNERLQEGIEASSKQRNMNILLSPEFQSFCRIIRRTFPELDKCATEEPLFMLGWNNKRHLLSCNRNNLDLIIKSMKDARDDNYALFKRYDFSNEVIYKQVSNRVASMFNTISKYYELNK
jgi:DNA invertase Pin-like site-specific DNA recombinase